MKGANRFPFDWLVMLVGLAIGFAAIIYVAFPTTDNIEAADTRSKASSSPEPVSEKDSIKSAKSKCMAIHADNGFKFEVFGIRPKDVGGEMLVVLTGKGKDKGDYRNCVTTMDGLTVLRFNGP